MSREFILNGSILKVCGRYMLPSVAGMVGASAYVLADTCFVANAIGETGLAALNIVLPAYCLMSATGLLIGVGAGSLYATAVGRGDRELARRRFSLALVAGGIATALFTAAGLFLTPVIVRLLGGTPEITPAAVAYLRTMLLISGAFIFNNILLAFARNDGAPNLAMAAMLLATGGNILLDYLFMYPLKLGMFGAAFASGLAAAGGLALLAGRFIRHRRRFKLRFRLAQCRELPALLPPGLPGFVTELSSGIVIWLFNLAILRTAAGNTGIAAYGIIANLALIAAAVFTGIGQGIQPIVSTNFGAGRHTRIRHTIQLAAAAAAAAGFALYGGCVLFDTQLISLFNRDGSTTLAAITADGIRRYFAALPFMGVNIVLCAAAATIARARLAFTGAILRGGLLPAICLAILAPYGLTAIWLTTPAAELFTLALLLPPLLRRRHTPGGKGKTF